MPTTCAATTTTADDRTLTCALPEGHDGPVHQDEHGEAWGDPTRRLKDPSGQA